MKHSSEYSVAQLVPDIVVDELQDYLEKQEGTELSVRHWGTIASEALKFEDTEGRTSVLLSIFREQELIIRYVLLQNRRRGTLTHVVKRIQEALLGTVVTRFKVESVLTEEMKQWCLKHNLVPDGDTCCPNGLGGNYVAELSQCTFN